MIDSAAGYVAFLLHAHLPYVRQEQDAITLEERWFYEAVADTYLPLIEMLDKLLADGIDFGLTLSLSPTLLAMLEDPLMQQRTRAHLAALCELSHKEVQRLQGDAAFADTARMYASRYRRLSALYDRLGGDLIAKLRSLRDSGCVELITCAATHAFLPLVKNPEALRAQLEAAVTEFRRHFGSAPAGIWLPECGYTPAVEPHLQALGLRYFVVDPHAGDPATTKALGGAPRLTPSGACAFARDPEASTQVWSAEVGYPSDPDYREYYRDIGYELGRDGGAEWDYIKPYVLPDGVRIHTGLKYYRITGGDADVKEPYRPAHAAKKAQRDAEHFLTARQRQLRLLAENAAAASASDFGVRSASSAANPPMLVCPYDAELFGHWWFEGLQWLEAVLRGLDKRHSSVQTITFSAYMRRYPTAGKRAELPFSSWGRGGYAEVWLQPATDWVYPLLHEAEDRLIHAAKIYADPSRLTEFQRRVLNLAAKELMLAQSSDWTFIVDSGTVTEYAIHRINMHLHQFHDLLDCFQSSSEPEDSTSIALLERVDKSSKQLFPLLSYTLYSSKNSEKPVTFLKEPDPNPNKLYILMLAWEYPPHIIGGLARAVCDLSRHLAAMGHSVHVITSHAGDSPLYEIAEGVHVHRVPILLSQGRVHFWDWVFQMNMAFTDAVLALTDQGLRFDLIHAHDWLVYYAAKECKQLSGLPLIVTIHATEYGRNQGKLENEMQQRIHSLERKLTLEADRVIVCSHAMIKEVGDLFSLADSQIIRIPNGIEPYPKLEPAAAQVNSQLIQIIGDLKQERVLCFLGRLVFEKGLHILIEAMKLITERFPHVRLIIAGTGPALDWLRELSLPLADHVYFTGFLEEADKHYLLQQSHLCIFPSLYEPFGIAALEAMASGTPIVVSDVGGLSEIITHGVNGCKVPPGNANALAFQIIDLLLDPEYGAQLAGQAESNARSDYNWSHIAAVTADCYYQALEKGIKWEMCE